MNIRKGLSVATILVSTTWLTSATLAQSPVPANATPTLEQQFQDPPMEARPRVWWHWMNGNVTEDGIAKDLAWMKRVGIGGLQNFDVDLETPQIVDKRLVYMTPEWKKAFRFAAAEADRLGLELAIAASPGWSETGGPWVKAEDGLKKLVWSEVQVKSGRRFTGKLPSPPVATGPFLDMTAADPLAGVLIGTREQSDRFLRDYRQTLADLMASEHYGTVAKVAHEHGLKVYGEALEDNRPSLGDDIAMRSYADVPMAALWTYSREAGPNPSYIADMKGAASIAMRCSTQSKCRMGKSSLRAVRAIGRSS